MIFELNLEKAFFKLMQNLTSKLQFNGFLFSGRVVSSCSWWHSHHCPCLVLWTVYLFCLMLLVYLSQRLHVLSFIHVWHYGGCSRVNPVQLSMALFGVFSGTRWLSVTFYAVLLVFNATCQYFFFDWPIYHAIAWTIQLVHSRMTIR